MALKRYGKPHAEEVVMRAAWVAAIVSALLSTAAAQTTRPAPATEPARNWRYAPLADLQSSAEAGLVDAQLELADRLQTGRGAAQNDDQARQWLRKAADQGNVDAEMALAAMLADGTQADQQQATTLFRKAAAAGNTHALVMLGLCLKDGRGTKANAAEALGCFIRAAQAGDADGEYQLGECCRKGIGTRADPVAALNHFRKSADAGNPDAMTALADLYRAGEGTSPRPPEAMALYLRAAEKGSTAAQWQLARMYRDGDGVARDTAKAIVWLKKLSLAKHADAQHALAVLDPDEFKQIAQPLRLRGQFIDEHQIGMVVKFNGEVIEADANGWKILPSIRSGPGHPVQVKPPVNVQAILARLSRKTSNHSQRIHEERGDARAVPAGPAPLSGTDPNRVRQAMCVSIWGRLVDQSKVDAIVFEVAPPSFEWKYKLKDVAGITAGTTQNYTLLGAFKNTGATPLRNVKLHVRAYEESSTSEFSKDYVIDRVNAGETLNFTIDLKLHNYSTSGGTSLPKVEMQVVEYEY